MVQEGRGKLGINLERAVYILPLESVGWRRESVYDREFFPNRLDNEIRGFHVLPGTSTSKVHTNGQLGTSAKFRDGTKAMVGFWCSRVFRRKRSCVGVVGDRPIIRVRTPRFWQASIISKVRVTLGCISRHEHEQHDHAKSLNNDREKR